MIAPWKELTAGLFWAFLGSLNSRVRKDGSVGGCSEQGKRRTLCAGYKWNRTNPEHCGDQLWMGELPFFSFSGDQGISAMVTIVKGFPGGASGKEPACQCRRLRDASSVPEWGRFPGGGNGNPLQNFCLENPRGQREELGRQQSMGSQTVGQDWQSMHTVVKNHCSTQPWWVKRSPGERLSHTSYFCKWKTFFMGSFWLCSV